MSMDEWNVDFVIDDDVDMFRSAPALREMQDDLEQFVKRQADLTPYKTPPRSDLQRPLTPTTSTNGVPEPKPIQLDDDSAVSEILHERTVRALSPLRSLEEAAPPAATKTTTTTTLVPLSHSSKSSPPPVVTFVVAAVPTAGQRQQHPQQVVEDADARRKRIVDELLSARRRASGVISVSQQQSGVVVLAPQPTQQGHTVGDNITPSFSAMQTRPPSTHLSPVSVIVTHHDDQSGGQYSAFSALPDGPLSLFGNGGSPSQDIVNSRGESPEQQQQQQRVVVVTPPPSAVLKPTSTATTSTVFVSAPTTSTSTTAAPVTPRQTAAAAAVQGGAALENVSLVVLKEESFEDGTATQRFYSRGRLTTPRAPDDVRGNRADMVAILLKTAHHIQLQAEDELTGALRQQTNEHSHYLLVSQQSQQPRARRVLTPPPEALLPTNEATVVVSLPRGDAPAASSFLSPSQFPRYISADNTPDKVCSPYPINDLFTSSASSGGVAGASTTYGGQQQPSTTNSGINVRGGMTTSTTTPPHSSRVHSASPHPQNPYSTAVTLLGSPPQQQQPQYHPLVVLHQQQQHPPASIADDNWIPPRAKGRVATLGPDIRRAATLPEKRFDVAVGTASYAAAELMDQVKRTTQHLHKDPAAAVSNAPPPPPPTTLPLRAIASMHFPQRPPPTDVPLVSKNVAVSSHERALLHGSDQPAPRPSTNTAIRSPQQQQQQHQQQRPVVHVAPPPPPVRAPLALSSQPAAPPQQPHRSPTYEALQVHEPYTPTSDNSPSRSMAALRRSRSVTFL